MPTIDELIDLTKKAQEKRTALERLAQQQVANQPFLQQGQSPATALTGRGTPEQQRAAISMFSRGLNRGPRETGIGALGEGFERGMALKDELAGRAKLEGMAGAEQEVKGAESALRDQASIYNLQQEEAKQSAQGGKTGTVSFGGQVWQTDAQGRPVRPLGATEGSLTRSDDERVRQDKAQAAQQEKIAADMTKLITAADYGAAVQEDVEQIKKGIGWWTSGMAGGTGQWVPGTDAYDQRLAVDSLRAKLGIDKLRELRAAAKSGASGMGNLTEKELDRLESAIAKIDLGGTEAAQKRALADIERYFQPALDAYANVFGADKLSGEKVRNYNPATGGFE